MIHTEILDQKRINLLPSISVLACDFYLAGGTALALQLGHRDSIDFDFFTDKPINTEQLWTKIKAQFSSIPLQKTQEEINTLSCNIDDDVRLSFFSYPYPLILPTIDAENLQLASLEDIGAMKLSAITSRATRKDYVDLYFILQKHSLSSLLQYCTQKFPQLDHALILKSLVYFADLVEEPIAYMPEFVVSNEIIESFLMQTVQNYFAK